MMNNLPKNRLKKILATWLVVMIPFCGCTISLQNYTSTPDRESLIPANQEKVTPQMDLYPVTSETDEYEDPIPLPYPVNTAGAEDSAFILPDGKTLYVWFTPDVSKPAEEQVLDGVTGIYVFYRINETWSDAERVFLQDPEKLALDGCVFVQNTIMFFCSVREGYSGLHWFSADLVEGKWRDWKVVDFNPVYEIGELHITSDGGELYFHSARPGGKGGFDIWVSEKVNGEWQPPMNVDVVNSAYSDGWPSISQDGLELWFTRGNGAPSLFRSLRVNGEWTEPQKMFSNFSGEASIDNDGNIYFTHHFYKDGVMLESDIYYAKKITP